MNKLNTLPENNLPALNKEDNRFGKCRLCDKDITNKMERNQQVIRLVVEHSLGGMWDDMGTYYLCSFNCWTKLNLKEEY